jgi:hypothetical protein
MKQRFPSIDWPFWLPLSAAAAALIWQPAWKPIVGIADNGDFAWLSSPFGLQPTASTFEDRYYHYVVREWATTGSWHRPLFLCASVPLLFAARLINVLVSPKGLFDLRVLGLVQAAVALGGLALFLYAVRVSLKTRRPWMRLAIGLLAGVMLTDTTHAVHLNSFFQTGATLAFSGWMVGAFALIAADGRLTRQRAALACIGSGMFLWSKPQMVPVGLLAALLLFRSRTLAEEPRARRFATMASGLLILASIALAAYPRSSNSLRGPIARVNMYHAVLTGLLEVSPERARDLAELGLPSQYAQYIGTSCLDPEMKDVNVHGAEWRATYFDRVGYARLLLFYVRHPGRLLALINRATKEWGEHPSYGYGMYEKESANSTKRLLLWDRVRAVLPHSAVMAGLLALLSIAGLAGRGVSRSAAERYGFEVFAAICIMALAQFVLVPVASGLPEVGRHLYPFQVLLDWCCVMTAWLVGRRFNAERREAAAVAASDTERRGKSGERALLPE